MPEDHFGRVRKERNVLNQVEADLRVALHDFALFGGKLPRFEKNGVGHTELSVLRSKVLMKVGAGEQERGQGDRQQ